MARKRASMREGPLAELFRATEAAQRQAEQQREGRGGRRRRTEPEERTVEHVPTWEEAARTEPAAPPPPRPGAPASDSRRLRLLSRRSRATSSRCPRLRRALYRAPQDDTGAYLAVIKVVGVGGAGLNAVNRMIDAGISAGRVHRRQHRHPAAAHERRAA